MSESPKIAGIVLAAGFSRRLGRPKQTVMLGGETLLERAARIAREAGLGPIVVALNASLFESEADKLTFVGCVPALNEEAGEGMASSIRVGLRALEGRALSGVVIMTCDQIAVSSEHLQALCAAVGEVAGSEYAGRVGVPAYFPASCFGELLALRGDQGARDLLRGARSLPTEALALDVDTEQELRQAQAWVASRG